MNAKHANQAREVVSAIEELSRTSPRLSDATPDYDVVVGQVKGLGVLIAENLEDESIGAKIKDHYTKNPEAFQCILSCLSQMKDPLRVVMEKILSAAAIVNLTENGQETIKLEAVARGRVYWNTFGTDKLQRELFNRIKASWFSASSQPFVDNIFLSMPSDRTELIRNIMWHDGARLIDQYCRVHGLRNHLAQWNDRKVLAVDYSDGEDADYLSTFLMSMSVISAC